MLQETPVDLVIRAMRVHDEASGDPAGARRAAELLVAEGRREGPCEGLVEALRALAQCHRSPRRSRSSPSL